MTEKRTAYVATDLDRLSAEEKLRLMAQIIIRQQDLMQQMEAEWEKVRPLLAEIRARQGEVECSNS